MTAGEGGGHTAPAVTDEELIAAVHQVASDGDSGDPVELHAAADRLQELVLAASKEVWVVVADYGLNGAGVLGVFDREPTEDELHELESTNFEGAPYGPRSVTGWGGFEVLELEVRS